MEAIATATLRIVSAAFEPGQPVPKKYTCEGEDVNPPIGICTVPETAASIAIIAEDPDATHGTFVHWLVWNIPPGTAVGENSNPGISGRNGFGKTGYGGPCPPSGTHRYFFRVYALNKLLDIPAGSERKALEQAMEGHIVASGELMGTFAKHKS
ncbi:YbhB/YbcL family Raf kinase inhibitor-like protein [Deminuibacter soli]|uniref:YbhB/YbcL family Raf kinase inhibitor-like protein n=2 Tax=Deminuibacter soli TaxID=2291815 RepID=A0A3E1NH90_9BACT|nr:YbhB/YbcL family Raf kinase inhibitor-like protein [Deminuibacter soli]